MEKIQKMITPKKEIIIKMICLIVLIILNMAIYFNGISLSCDKCVILQKTHIPGSPDEKDSINEIKLNEVYNNLINGTCLLRQGEL